VLGGLFVTPAVTAIVEALTATSATGTIAVVGNARLARALAASRDVIAVGLSARASRKLPQAVATVSAIDPTALAAVVGVDLATDPAWEPTLRAWSLLVRDGGTIAFVDRGHAAEASRRALCGGLTEIEQRHAGRIIVTSGLVTHVA
jgi:hypothetical protein